MRILEDALLAFEELQTLQNVDGSRAELMKELKDLKLLRCLAIAEVKTEDGFALSNALHEMKYLESLSVASNRGEKIDLQSMKSPPLLLECSA